MHTNLTLSCKNSDMIYTCMFYHMVELDVHVCKLVKLMFKLLKRLFSLFLDTLKFKEAYTIQMYIKKIHATCNFVIIQLLDKC